jgi:putative protease
MARAFNGRQLELLAPAGTLPILESLIDSGADAFYLGGKGLNMRLHRRDFNFSDEELVTAAQLCRLRGLRLYITVNKLMGKADLAAAPGYLEFLARDVRPDALIVQDLAVPAIIAERGLSLALHASVMMNAHDEAGLRALTGLGFSRVVLSRESSLDDVRRLLDATGMEMEYFTHGDLCAAHGSQCLYSGMLFGLSSNRGLCMKPCRWPFSATMGGRTYGPGFPLAVRDMCLYPELEAAALAGVTSFKIEGRMRSADYLRGILVAYAGALDAICGNMNDDSRPGAESGYAALFEHRLRDFTTAFAHGNPGAAMLNSRWEGTGKFYSTGRVFSVATTEPPATSDEGTRIVAVFEEAKAARKGTTGSINPAFNLVETHPTARTVPVLAVLVDTAEAAAVAFSAGADRAILSGAPYEPAAPVTREELADLQHSHPDRKVSLALPGMLNDADYQAWEHTLTACSGLFDELYISQLGADDRFRGVAALAGDSSLNVLNARAAAAWAKRGLSSVCASLEACATDLADLVSASPIPVEVVVHGRPGAMRLSLDLAACIATMESMESTGQTAQDAVQNRITLHDERGSSHPIVRDFWGTYHLLPTKALRLLPLVPSLRWLGVARFRIDGTGYDAESLRTICTAYRAVLDGADPAILGTGSEPAGVWFGALRTGLEPEPLH